MDDIAIRVEGLGKRFRLSHAGGGSRYRTLREDVLGLPRRLLAGLRGRHYEREEFWALKDVTFEVKRGDVLGIIGRNGAGKSTLLKILSRIMDPTCGEATVQGRIGSLLEVGTGFHPELTGRENIFLSGALLGMRRDEVRHRFDEIVAFAGVEKFLDTACKHYSSGMYARLGFAVAAHLDAEILLVDEVLAVGDAEFQERCLNKMNGLTAEGGALILVSHNLVTITGLADRVLWIDQGKIMADGETNGVVMSYREDIQRAGATPHSWYYRMRSAHMIIESAALWVKHTSVSSVASGEEAEFVIHYRTEGIPLDSWSFSLLLFRDGEKVTNLWTNYRKGLGLKLDSSGKIRCIVPNWPFRRGDFHVDLFVHRGPQTEVWIEQLLVFHSVDGDYYRSGVITNSDQGSIFIQHEWRHYANE